MSGDFTSTKNPSATALSIEMSAIKQIELLSKEQKGVMSLAQGIPSFPTASHIRQAAHKAINDGLVDKYTSPFGIDSLREAIAKKLQKENKIKADVSQIIVTHGALEGLMATFMALLNPSDEIIILSPDYASHITQTVIARNGTRPVMVALVETEEEWILDPEQIDAAINPRTKAILICNPCNPTGKVYSISELKLIAEIALKHNLFIITDEIYEHLTFGRNKHVSIGSFPEVSARTISVFGVSKSYSMTGWRIGYVVSNSKLTSQIIKIHDSLVTCATAVSQYAALAAITGPQDIVEKYRQEYQSRLEFVTSQLSKTDKLIFIKPQGAYYIFPRFKKTVNDNDVARRILEEAKVAVVPGSAFGLGGQNHIRISFGGDDKKLKIAIPRLLDFLNSSRTV